MRKSICVGEERITMLFGIFFLELIYRFIYRFFRLVRILRYFGQALRDSIVNYPGQIYSWPFYYDEALDDSSLNHFFILGTL
jgi:hypothetical protein